MGLIDGILEDLDGLCRLVYRNYRIAHEAKVTRRVCLIFGDVKYRGSCGSGIFCDFYSIGFGNNFLEIVASNDEEYYFSFGKNILDAVLQCGGGKGCDDLANYCSIKSLEQHVAKIKTNLAR